MKKCRFGLWAAAVISILFYLPAQRSTASAVVVSPNIVISQIYGGGGNGASSQYTHDYVELFNRGDAPVSLNGWSTQYASSGGTNWLVTPLTNVSLQPGQYYLIQYAGGTNGGVAPLPTPDLIAPQVTTQSGTFIPNLSGTSGKLALVNSTTPLPANTCPVDASIVDLLGYGDSASCFEGARTANLSNTSAAKRTGEGCGDTDNNNADFTLVAPAPRNTASSTVSCNLGAILQAGIQASPNVVSPGGNMLLTVTVIPATTPPSTGISATGNLSDIGGAASQGFFNDGTHGDATANDNVHSFLATIPVVFPGGFRNVTATVSDAQSRTVNLALSITINAPLPDDDPLLPGNPSAATGDIANENNYLMLKPQYSLSYNRSRGTANWVAWRLDSSWIGSTQRQDDFRPDSVLPAGWYQVADFDYSGSGYDRGHMCPSGDRTNSVPNNSATFLMTNIVPQLGANNQGPWNDFENYCRSLAAQGNEIYIISGVHGNIGTIAQGRVVIPAITWKVVLVLPNGTNDLQRIGKGTRAFGIIVSNQPPVNQNALWREFRVPVNTVENITGFDFFSKIPLNTQELIERRRDTQ
ncbi:MAG: DNA/RNA non-specific endonuclease [Pyrinomonadaceae bacterium]